MSCTPDTLPVPIAGDTRSNNLSMHGMALILLLQHQVARGVTGLRRVKLTIAVIAIERSSDLGPPMAYTSTYRHDAAGEDGAEGMGVFILGGADSPAWKSHGKQPLL